MRKNVSLGVVIILVGIIWLLSNLDIFSFSVVDVFFRSLGRLWPIILIGIGVNILLKENAVVRLLVWLIIFMTIFVYGIFTVNNGTGYDYHYSPHYNDTKSHDYTLTKEEATVEGKLNFNFGAGQLTLASIDNNLMEVKSNIPDLKYDHRFQDGNKKVILDFNKTKYSFQGNHEKLFCNMNLHQGVTWEMDLDLGAAKGNLDLKNLIINKIDLDVGAADLDLYLGEKSMGQNRIDINAGASNLEIYVPNEAGLKVKIDSALSGNNLSNLDLVKNGDYYISPDYESKDVQFLFDIDMGVGNLKFHRE